MGKLSKFEKLRRKADKNGWVVPVNSMMFSEDVWMRYWRQMADHRFDQSLGRPIPPHRTGGTIRQC